MTNAKIDKWALDTTRQIISSVLRNKSVKVYLFGSRATGDVHRFSDIDIALEAKRGPVHDKLLVTINELLEDSNIPYTVDVVDLAHVSEKLRDRVYKEGIKWTA